MISPPPGPAPFTTPEPCPPHGWSPATAAEAVAPPRGEIQVWHIDLDAAPRRHARDLALLDAAERHRAERFATAPLRWRYVAAHGALRRILGGMLGADPACIRLAADERGRPRLAGNPPPALDFNLSHSEGAALLAVAAGPRVGIDLERIRAAPPLEIARDVFCARERTAFARLGGAARAAAFYALWTRKEALVKGLGCGLDTDLPSLDVSASRPSGAPDGWRLRALPALPGFAAALALQGEALPIRCRALGTD